ncbi:hypothetical protein RXV95_05925 [Novosphingobium sp. ZN18A2]|uniref:hypothetical protein n=1 Tax=Novosphingobium sp. ZN18A2 TaxID=3079861 RepID=UPI0030CE62F4
MRNSGAPGPHDAVGDQMRAAVDRAIGALWSFHQRPGPGGIDWSAIDGCSTLEEYRSELASAPGNLLAAARAFLPDWTGLTADEQAALATIIDAAELVARANAFLPDRHRLPPGERTALASVIEAADALTLRGEATRGETMRRD